MLVLLLSEFFFFIKGNFLFFSFLSLRRPIILSPPPNYISVGSFPLSCSGFCCAWGRLWMRVILLISVLYFDAKTAIVPEYDWWRDCSNSSLTIYFFYLLPHFSRGFLTPTPCSHGLSFHHFYYLFFRVFVHPSFLVPYSPNLFFVSLVSVAHKGFFLAIGVGIFFFFRFHFRWERGGGGMGGVSCVL